LYPRYSVAISVFVSVDGGSNVAPLASIRDASSCNLRALERPVWTIGTLDAGFFVGDRTHCGGGASLHRGRRSTCPPRTSSPSNRSTLSPKDAGRDSGLNPSTASMPSLSASRLWL
jgi:hypothetical protein